MALKFLDQIELKGKKVLVRFDFNVPLKEDENHSGDYIITDTTRIDLALPSIKYILESGASKLIMMSHLGRPKGKPTAKYSLRPVAEYLAKNLNTEVILSSSAVDAGVKDLLNLPDTKIVLLENLRFHPEEEANNREFARKLSTLAEIYVNDAFGAAHRKHASTYDINFFFSNKAAAGFLMKKEIEALQKIVDNPKRPFVAILGGAKVADKIQTIERLLVMVDKMLIGGAMAYPFLAAKAISIGKSLCSEEDLKLAKKILLQDKGNKILLPVDHIVGVDPKDNQDPGIKTSGVEISDDYMGLDIGENTCARFTQEMNKAKTIFWNGPMGLFENKMYEQGTKSIAQAMSKSTSHAFTVVGGGDSVNAVNEFHLASEFSHVSTGGGASLEFIENGFLPGVNALKFGVNQ